MKKNRKNKKTFSLLGKIKNIRDKRKSSLKISCTSCTCFEKSWRARTAFRSYTLHLYSLSRISMIRSPDAYSKSSFISNTSYFVAVVVDLVLAGADIVWTFNSEAGVKVFVWILNSPSTGSATLANVPSAVSFPPPSPGFSPRRWGRSSVSRS